VELARLGLLLPAMVAVRLDADDTLSGAAEVALCDLAEAQHMPPTTTNWWRVRRCRCATSA
jgi:hypothetical protein